MVYASSLVFYPSFYEHILWFIQATSLYNTHQKNISVYAPKSILKKLQTSTRVRVSKIGKK